MTDQSIRPIAIYLPQFHPIPENDKWWGRGFTEWTNVVKARPLFKEHYQPHLPADLGFYDLRLIEILEQQAQLAEENGVHGFCFYHYWFDGRKILEKPVEQMLATGKPKFPFMLCWANENWTRTWDGLDQEILLKQSYSLEDDRNHIKYLLDFFQDSRYIKIDNKPVFAIYKSQLLPNPEATINIWREEALRQGMELYICRFENFGTYGQDYVKMGFDAAIDFQPFSSTLDAFRLRVRKENESKYLGDLERKFLELTKQKEKIDTIKHKQIAWQDYNKYVDFYFENFNFPNNYILYPGLFPSWDNTARKGKQSYLFKNSNPSKFREWLLFLKNGFKPPSEEENLIFINAWNEWAEGNHLEPCQKWGNGYLDAVKQIFGD